MSDPLISFAMGILFLFGLVVLYAMALWGYRRWLILRNGACWMCQRRPRIKGRRLCEDCRVLLMLAGWEDGEYEATLEELKDL